MGEDAGTKPEYGRRLMVNIIDDVARKNPERTWVKIPRSANAGDGWKAVSFKTGANAINRIAHKIIEILGKPAQGKFPTIAYIGPNDIRYLILMFAAVKAGYQVRDSPIIPPRPHYVLCLLTLNDRPCSSRLETRMKPSTVSWSELTATWCCMRPHSRP
jgi:hypothetical protein